MCLAVPMQVVETDGRTVRCIARGAERTASLLLYPGDLLPAVGEHVIISQGQVVAVVPPEEAMAAWALFDQILAIEDRVWQVGSGG